MVNYDALRRRSLYCFIVFLGLSAVLAAVLVLVGDFGWLESRVLITTLTISGVSIDAMGCALALERRAAQVLPKVGIALALASGVLVLVGCWGDVYGEAYWKLTAILTLFAIATTHVSLLSMVGLPVSQRWLHPITEGAIFLTATLVSIAIIGEVSDIDYYKLVVIAAIAVALGTLVIPILGRIAAPADQPPLQLTHLHDDLYQDAKGQVYRLTPVATPADKSG